MLDRLAGLETEYSLRFQPAQPGGPRVPNSVLFDRILVHLRGRMPLAKAIVAEFGWFLANGGSIKLERIPFLAMLPAAGLVEGATPECRGPRQLLLHQRAQDVLFSRAAAASGQSDGTAALLKNNHDGRGSRFGSHENYEAEVASQSSLHWWRLGIAGLMPFLVPLVVISVLILCILYLIILLPLLYLCGGRARQPPAWWDTVLAWLMRVCMLPPVLLAEIFIRLTAFRPHRRHMLAFLVSRPIITGAGIVDARGRFSLSPRARALLTICTTTTECSRGVFYFGHIWKGILGPMLGERGNFFRLFQPRQRLQITCGDSNMAQVAEYLKFGTTMLVLDALEAGFMNDAPRLRSPLRALHLICDDPTLKATVPLDQSRRWTGLQIQRYYLEACRRFVEHQHVTEKQHAMQREEAANVLRLWEETLEDLESHPQRLVGKIDWVTKLHLLQATSVDARRKLDLRYHELTKEGYYLQLEAVGVAPTLVEPEEVLTTLGIPPSGTPATQRGDLIRKYAASTEPIAVSWNLVVLGTGPLARTIQLQPPRQSEEGKPPSPPQA